MVETDTPLDLNAACLHPRSTHRHGTYACYVLDKCRCAACTEARARWGRVQARRRLYAQHGVEQYAPYVDASRALEHVEELRAAGLGYKEVARRAGVAASTVHALLWETPSRGRGRRTRMKRDTVERILAVPVPDVDDLKDGRCIDATRSRNRVRALASIGYSIGEQARRAGVDNQRLRRVMSPGSMTTAATHRAIELLFTELWDKPHNPTDCHSMAAATRTRNAARRKGWPMPIDLDERGYIDTDDVPMDDEPIIDTIAIERVLAGDWAPLTSAEINEAIRRGRARGLPVKEIARLLRLQRNTVHKRVERFGLSTHRRTAA